MRRVDLLCVCISFFSYVEGARSVLRPKDPLMPEIVTRWIGDTKTYHFKDYHLEEQTLFTKFNRNYFFKHILPQGPVTYRYDQEKSIDGTVLDKLATELIKELNQHKTKFTHFKVLKTDDFNARTISGTAIFKYKEYPFVLKLFIKTPETFVQPFSEGWVPSFFFVMGGGINRYLSGFTRVRNLELVRQKIANDPYWCSIVDTPRKWFWTPQDGKWFELMSKNIGTQPQQSITLPSVYGIIADAIESKKTLSLAYKDERDLALRLAHFLENRIDAHVDNFMIEKGTGKIVIVDTEHFPTMVGLKEPLVYDTYPQWYCKLAWKCLVDNVSYHKKYRRTLQANPTPPLLPYD
jgi:hypothetical protein